MILFVVMLCMLALVVQGGEVQLTNSYARKSYDVLDRSDRDLPLELMIVVKQKNTQHLEEELLKVSMPSSPMYGQHWTEEQVVEFTSNPTGVAAVKEFIKLNQLIETKESTGHGHFIYVQGTVSQWEQLLHASFYQYRFNSQTNVKMNGMIETKAEEYTLPDELQDHVSFLSGVLHMGKHESAVPAQIDLTTSNPSEFENNSEKRHLRSATGATTTSITMATRSPAPSTQEAKNNAKLGAANQCEFNFGPCVSPAFLREHYGMQTDDVATENSSQMIYSSIEQNYSPADLSIFQEHFKLPTTNMNYLGPSNPAYDLDATCKTESTESNCFEANLDVQYITTTGQGSKSYFSYDDHTSFLLPWISNIYNEANGQIRPDIISISYGAPEEELLQSYCQSFDQELIKLALLGTTVFASAGDDGAPGNSKITNCNDAIYEPTWPASSPYIVAVGATMGPESGTPEVVCSAGTGSGITSGGGFSNIYSKPLWQTNAVSKYFATVSTKPGPGYNMSNRGYPDIAMLGNKFFVVFGDKAGLFDGTSASSPSIAGMFATINSARKAAGKSTLGFLSPAIYASYDDGSYSAWTRDITSGDNTCIRQGTPQICCAQIGYHATEGWDPVSGVGVPKFQEMKDYFLRLTFEGGSFAPVSAPTPVPGQPSQAPTFIPTGPTQTPTFTPTVYDNIDFGVTQRLSSVDISAYNSSHVSCHTVLVTTIVRAINLPSDTLGSVVALTVKDDATNPGKNVILQYYIKFFDASQSTESVTKMLKASVKSGEFTEILQSEADKQNATALMEASCLNSDIAVGVNPPLPPAKEIFVTEPVDNGYTATYIATGMTITILVLGLCLFFYYYQHKNAGHEDANVDKNAPKMKVIEGTVDVVKAPVRGKVVTSPFHTTQEEADAIRDQSLASTPSFSGSSADVRTSTASSTASSRGGMNDGQKNKMEDTSNLNRISLALGKTDALGTNKGSAKTTSRATASNPTHQL